VRLTRRGRLVAFAASVGILATVVVSAGQIADASGSTAATEHVTVVVQSGQTLWGIARAAAPDHDPRLVISQIRELNDLGTGSIIPGQALVVPTVA
jgi:LysM repeat protein